MKILTLELQAFGPFKGFEAIDFNQFENNRIFLIGGKTGSGKTTIFDAISYALFGKMTGEFKDDSTARSQYADKTCETFVRLRFSKDNKEYEIYRKPRYFVEGRKTAYNPEIYFKEIANGSERVLSTKISDANLKIVDVIGFKYEQFKQIVVLPQGEFIKILNAKSKEREELLSAILDTSLYSNITESLKDKSKKLYSKINEVTIKTDAILKDNNVNNIDELKANKDTLNEELDKKKSNLDKLTNEVNSLDKKIIEIEKNNSNIKSLNSFKESLNSLIANNPNIDYDRERLQLLKGIKDISSTYYLLNSKKKEYLKEENSLKDNKNKLREVKIEYDKLDSYKFESNESNNKIIELKKTIAEFEAMKEKLNKLNNNLSKIDNTNIEIDKCNERIKRQTLGIAKAKEEIEDLRKNLNSNLEYINSYDNKEFEKANKLNDDYNRRIELENKLNNHINSLKLEEELLEANKKELAFNELEYSRVDNIIKNNELLKYKDMIKDNTPCPLCGSLNHPSPVTALELKDISLDIINKRINSLNNNINKNEAKIELATKEINELKANSLYKLDLSLLDKVRDDYNRALENQSKFFKLSSENKELNNSINELDSKITKASDALIILNNNLNDYNIKLSNLKLESDTLKVELDNYLKGEDINLLLANKTSELNSLISLKARNDKKIESITNSYTALNTSINNNIDRIDILNKEITDLNTSFNIMLLDLKIDYIEYESLLLNINEINNLEVRINRYDNLLKEYNNKIDLLTNLITGSEIIDTNLLHEDLNKLNNELKAINKEYLDLNSSYSIINNSIKTYIKLTESIKDTLDEYKMVEYMYLLCSGNLSGHKKISIQKFVLMKLLDKILTYANHYLKLFSSNRYTLLREENENTSDKGLELVVYDDHTGFNRGVSSLSGGESFMTALALALGTSECIMSINGGIKMENIFIDEGFGTLDDEALNNAVEALIELAQGGRLIGIISHVDSIKALIPQGIDVIKSKNGSKIEINL